MKTFSTWKDTYSAGKVQAASGRRASGHEPKLVWNSIQERASLDAYRPILMEVQHGTCLYCGKSLPKQTEVDHFIPWSRYPADLGHNFVLAHKTCNKDKSDYLVAEKHLTAWAERNRLHQGELQSRLKEAALSCDESAAIQIAKWIYQQTEKANGQVWVMEKVLQHLSPGWAHCLFA